ncbi:uncharacterized protein LOC112588989 [Harpegnathos saltator]|uniref:uncharacterized protein LOC112588989 n=1 Tax=Harpegnathos saltator TaxID=610380 RepID=UPI000DBEE077|nr:uncharacterized protein LOC112588989 [Harpegnathos saltator]
MAELLQQKQVQRTIERSLENFRKIGKVRLTSATVRSRITALKDSWHQFQTGSAILLKLIPEENQASINYIRNGAFDATEEAYLTTLDVSERLEELDPPVSPLRNGDTSQFLRTSDLPLADPEPASTAPIQIIIGADLYNEIILDGLRKGAVGQPIAQRSIFGWVISGSVSTEFIATSHSVRDAVHALPSLKVSTHHCALSSDLEEDLKRFWEVEEIPHHSAVPPTDEQCEQHFQNTHSHCADGKYTVRLPFKTALPIAIGDSRERERKLFVSLTRRLRSHPTQAAEYNAFMKEYELLGHMRRAPVAAASSESQCVFIPHHPVFREDSVTTHLRVVFNASCLTANGTSLNDHLLTGPKLQTDITAVILKWRRYQYVYSADIAKMYRQIRLDEHDLNYQRILWNSDFSESPIEYQLLTNAGPAWSPEPMPNCMAFATPPTPLTPPRYT